MSSFQSNGDEVWFDVNGVPLKWHVPVGVLFDLMATQHADGSAVLPWALSVNFHSYPSGELMRCASEEAIRSLYTNSLKEANYLKHGDGGRVNKLTLDDSNNLWTGLLRHDFDIFWSANEKLVCADAADLKCVPLRICERDKPTTQALFVPLDDAGEQRTLADLLRSVLPDRFAHLSNATPNTGRPPIVVVQGIAPPLDTSVFWLATHLAHPDNFLYVIIKQS
jgi:autophagy-related protein 5